jgi:hypothetical protein
MIAINWAMGILGLAFGHICLSVVHIIQHVEYVNDINDSFKGQSLWKLFWEYTLLS